MLINENLDNGIAYEVRSYFVHKTKPNLFTVIVGTGYTPHLPIIDIYKPSTACHIERRKTEIEGSEVLFSHYCGYSLLGDGMEGVYLYCSQTHPYSTYSIL